MGHYRSEMGGYESPLEKKERVRRRLIHAAIEKMSLGEFTVEDLPALLRFLGFRHDMSSRHVQYVSDREAEEVLEKKIRRARKK